MEREVSRPLPTMELISQRASVGDYEAYAAKHGLEFWNVILNFYGPKDIYANWAYAKKLFGYIPGVRFENENYACTAEEPRSRKRH